jgi:hypothetical protein
MTQDVYWRVLDHINSFQSQSDVWLSSLPKGAHEKIWAFISEEASKIPIVEPSDYSNLSDLNEATNQRPNLAKQKLWEYVSDNGPFVFEGGRCYFILVHQFDFFDWQHMRIPADDVTDIAQKAFLSKRILHPDEFKVIKNRDRLLFLGAVGMIVFYYVIQLLVMSL